jgi:transcriptional regulator with XRE-family HTH domain
MGPGAGVLPHEPSGGPARRKAVELSAFFERLRQVLDDRAMSQADLARELGVGVATVSEWFTRGRVPNGDVMLRLPRVLDVNGHWSAHRPGRARPDRRRRRRSRTSAAARRAGADGPLPG